MCSTVGFAEGGHVGGIAAEAPYVGAYPLESENNVEQPQIARVCVFLPADPAQVEMAREIEPVIEADDDDVMSCSEVGPVIQRNAARTEGVSASVQPHHYRSLIWPVQTRRPQVEDKTVFAHLPWPHHIAQELV